MRFAVDLRVGWLTRTKPGVRLGVTVTVEVGVEGA